MRQKVKRRYKLLLIVCAAIVSAFVLLNIKYAHQEELQEKSDESLPISDMEPTQEPIHLYKQLNKKHTIDAIVIDYGMKECYSYHLEPVLIEPEQGAALLFPDDQSPQIEEQIDGITKTTTENGNCIVTQEGLFTYFKDGDDNEARKYGEISNLLSYYKESFPDDEYRSLEFMTMEEAVESAENIISKFVDCFDPVLESGVGLTNLQLMEYQQLLLQEETYNEFGKVEILDNLSKKYDSYLLNFSFSMQGIPVYGNNDEPSIRYATGQYPPFPCEATVLISREGVVSLRIIGVYRELSRYYEGTLYPIENVILNYEKKYDLLILEDDYLLSRIFLEYIPITTDEGIVLKPYWCFVTDRKYYNYELADEIWYKAAFGDRFNAVSGADLTYGG